MFQDTCHVFIVWQFTAPYVGYLSKSKKNFRWMSNIKSLSLPHSKPNIEKLYRALWFLVWILTIVMANQAVFVAPILLEEHPAEAFFKLIVHSTGRWLWVKSIYRWSFLDWFCKSYRVCTCSGCRLKCPQL